MSSHGLKHITSLIAQGMMQAYGQIFIGFAR
jgi:hypothetical protein